MEDILKIVKSLKDSGLLLEGVSKTIKNEAKEQKEGFLSMLLGILGASLLGNMLAGKGVRTGRSSSKRFSFKKRFLIPPHLLTNFEIQTYYQNEARFSGVYSRDKLPGKIKDGGYVINLDIGTHWITLHVNNKAVTYFDIFGVEHIPKEIKTIIKNNKNIIATIFRIQPYDSVMCGYFCVRFIDYMFKGNSLTEFTGLFLPDNFF